MGRITVALIAVGLASPACAQVQQGNPNAANQSMTGMSQNRASQQNQATQSDTTMMNAERGRTAAPPPPGGGATPRIGR